MGMLRFATKPDAIFPVLISDAIDEAIGEIELDPTSEGQVETYETIMPSSEKLFGLNDAKQQLRALQKALGETSLYQPTDYHWLLLYEVLEVYCDGFNEIPHGALCETYGIQRIDFNLLIDLFFWDNDFLDDDIPDMPFKARQQLGISPETFGLTAGMKPHPDELTLTLCDEGLAEGFDGQRCVTFLPGSKDYPSLPDVHAN